MILDAAGREVSETDYCPACGRTNTKARETAFGGYWKDVCTSCGTILAQGREDKLPLMR